MQIVAVTDPLMLGFRRMAMIGLKVEGDLRAVADDIAAIPEVSYVVVVSGSFDLLMEVVCEDDDHLLALLNDKVRSIPGVRSTETFTYLPLLQADLRMGNPMSDRTRTEHTYDVDDLNDKARRHLWMHFSRLGSYADARDPDHRRGEGLLPLGRARQALPRRAVGPLHGAARPRARRPRRGRGAQQAETLEYFPIWSYAHPPAIELAAKLAELAPGDLNRVFFTTGGSEAVESAWKLARQYFRAKGEGQRYKVIARETAYHGTTLGALAITGVPSLRTPFEPLTPGASPRAEHEPVPAPARQGRRRVLRLAHPRRSRSASSGRDPRRSPRSSSSRCRTPAAASCRPPGYFQRVREICDRYGVLLVSDEVICAFGRLGDDVRRAALRLPARHDHVRQGPHERVLAARRGDLSRPSSPSRSSTATSSFLHGITFGGHPVSCAVGIAQPRAVRGGGHPRPRARATKPGSASASRASATSRSSATSAGAGYFLALELVADPETEAHFTKEQGEDAAPRLPVARALRRRASSAAPTTAATRWCSSRRR